MFRWEWKPVLGAYAGDERGNFATMFALSVTAILGMVILAIDGSTAYKSKSSLQDVADAVSLMAVKSGETDRRKLEKIAAEYIAAHYAHLNPDDFKIKAIPQAGGTVTIELTRETPMNLAGMIGYKSLDVTAVSTATLQRRPLDLAMVLDNTTSMRGRKIRDLKDAADDLVDTLYSDPASRRMTQIGLVPFSTWVNVGPQNINANWLDQRGRSAQNTIYFDRTVSRFDLYNQLGRSWDGCVENRLPPYDVDDTAADPSRPDTLFQPAFHPDMSDHDRGGYSYVNDRQGGNSWERLRHADKYYVSLPPGQPGPAKRSDSSCDSRRAITPLTFAESDIRRGIRNMYAEGYTNIANGASWGFRVLSPNAPFTEARPFDDEDGTLKAMVILTDGEQTMDRNDRGQFGSAYTPYGFLGEPALPGKARLDGHNGKAALDDKLLKTCSAAKAKGILVYAITFDVRDADTRQTMKDCASTADTYFNADSGGDLSPIFKEIASSLSELRIAG